MFLKRLKIALLLLPLLLLFSFEKVKDWSSGRFSINKIITPLQWKIDVKEADVVLPMLKQQFSYLARGNQVYVFESADHQYVLKIFKQHTFREPFWYKVLNLSYNQRQTQKWGGGNKASLLRSLASYKLAYEKAADETGLLYAHLNKTNNLFKKIAVKDKLGRSFVIDLDEVVFFIQKKVIPLTDIIPKLDKKALSLLFKKFVELDIALLKKGILDRDPAVRNSALLGEKMIRVDVGLFGELREQKITRELVLFNMRKMHLWLKRNVPDQVGEFEKIVTKLASYYPLTAKREEKDAMILEELRLKNNLYNEKCVADSPSQQAGMGHGGQVGLEGEELLTL